MPSGAVIVPGFNPLLLVGVVVGLLNSECPQQDRAYESKYGAYSQHIELQGKVHVSASLVDPANANTKSSGPETGPTKAGFFGGRNRLPHLRAPQMIDRAAEKKFEGGNLDSAKLTAH